jgi:hypothetical protein
MGNRPDINTALLWEYDMETFNWEENYWIVIDRVAEYGRLEDWKEMVKLYDKNQILYAIDTSSVLSQRDKDFGRLFIYSDYLL